MRIHVTKDEFNEHHVWVSLDETLTRDVRVSTEAFIIASGDSRPAALQAARAELMRVANRIPNLPVRVL